MAGKSDTDILGTPVRQGLIQRVVTGVKYAISGATPTAWFGPMQPLPPVSQESAGRQRAYSPGINLQLEPRAEELTPFSTLRAFADNCTLVRGAIETRKDELTSLDWIIKPRRGKNDVSRIDELTNFFSYPDREHTFEDWFRAWLEDMFVLDAVALYPRLTKGGQLYSLEYIDAATINRKFDVDGRTPAPPDVAYQQVLYGAGAADYTQDSLIYLMRNPRTWKAFGFGPVEQIMMLNNIALRRDMQMLDEFTSGNIPEGLVTLPDDWSPEEVQDFQDWFDTLSGDTKRRKMVRFLPGGAKYVRTQTEYNPKFDEHLIRLVCWVFSIPPVGLVQGMNRAESLTQSDTAQRQGLLPWMKYSKRIFDSILRKYLNAADYEFSWQRDEVIDVMKQAQADQIYVTIKARTPQQVCENRGWDWLPENDEWLKTPAQTGLAGPAPETNSARLPEGDRSNEVQKIETEKKRPYYQKPIVKISSQES